jgi:uncharacterized membrane protein SpoIIM required for sporulation
LRVADRLTHREASWRELERLVDRLSQSQFGRPRPADVLRLGQLYRGVCSDLMLAESHDLPRDTVAYLHSLVGRTHNVLYQARGFRFQDWGRVLFELAPWRLRSDPALRLAAAVFVVSFLIFALLAAAQPQFARRIVGEQALEEIDHMYSQPIGKPRDDGLARDDPVMAGLYIQNNTSIGLQCFAWGIVFGVGSLVQLLDNGRILGTIFGHMATSPHAANFFNFVTAHSSFELTALVFAGAAGLRLGWGLIDTKGQTRLASLHREAKNALSALGASVVLFVMAAFIEGFVSASTLPYWVKANIAILSALLIAVYLTLGGRDRSMPSGRRAGTGEPGYLAELSSTAG